MVKIGQPKVKKTANWLTANATLNQLQKKLNQQQKNILPSEDTKTDTAGQERP
jgi:hypothetical protein